jgi:hypothetical protein
MLRLLLFTAVATIAAAAPVPREITLPSIVGCWQVCDYPMECEQVFTFHRNGTGSESLVWPDRTDSRPFNWHLSGRGRISIDGRSYPFQLSGDRLTLQLSGHAATLLRKGRCP